MHPPFSPVAAAARARALATRPPRKAPFFSTPSRPPTPCTATERAAPRMRRQRHLYCPSPGPLARPRNPPAPSPRPAAHQTLLGGCVCPWSRHGVKAGPTRSPPLSLPPPLGYIPFAPRPPLHRTPASSSLALGPVFPARSPTPALAPTDALPRRHQPTRRMLSPKTWLCRPLSLGFELPCPDPPAAALRNCRVWPRRPPFGVRAALPPHFPARPASTAPPPHTHTNLLHPLGPALECAAPPAAQLRSAIRS